MISFLHWVIVRNKYVLKTLSRDSITHFCDVLIEMNGSVQKVIPFILRVIKERKQCLDRRLHGLTEVWLLQRNHFPNDLLFYKGAISKSGIFAKLMLSSHESLKITLVFMIPTLRMIMIRKRKELFSQDTTFIQYFNIEMGFIGNWILFLPATLQVQSVRAL